MTKNQSNEGPLDHCMTREQAPSKKLTTAYVHYESLERQPDDEGRSIRMYDADEVDAFIERLQRGLGEQETATSQIPSARGDIAASGPRNGPTHEPPADWTGHWHSDPRRNPLLGNPQMGWNHPYTSQPPVPALPEYNQNIGDAGEAYLKSRGFDVRFLPGGFYWYELYEAMGKAAGLTSTKESEHG